MKTVMTLSALLFFGLLSRAQDPTSPNRSSDSAQLHSRPGHPWNHGGFKDSPGTRHHNGFGYRTMDGAPFGNGNSYGYAGRNGHRHQHRPGNPVRYTPEQRKQIAEINQDFHKKSAALYRNDNMTLKVYKAQLLTLIRERKSRMNGLLTDQQKKEMESFRKKKDEDAQVMAAARLERMKIRLNLNDQQTASLKSQQQIFWTQAKSIRENDSLLPDQKKEQIRDLVSRQKDALKNILTPEQVSQLENMHKQRFSRS